MIHETRPSVPESSACGPPQSHAPATRRRALAAALATELCDLTPEVWRRRATGATRSHLAYLDDDVELADLVADAWDLVRAAPPHDQVHCRSGVAGMVVVTDGSTWTLVARSGGPILIVSDRIRGILRIDGDPYTQDELTELIAELINVGQGLPAFDEPQLPPMPPLPRHDRQR